MQTERAATSNEGCRCRQVVVAAVAFERENRHSPPLSGRSTMPSKPNYNHQRAERDRAKKASKDAKMADRKEQAARRKAGEIDPPAEPEAAAPAPSPEE